MPRLVPALLLLLCAAAPAHAGDEMNLVAYTRLGKAVVFDAEPRPATGIGFGLRGETRTFAVDTSFANLALDLDPLESAGLLIAGSLLKIEVLRFLSPDRPRSAYVGGGLGWGLLSLGVDTPFKGGYTTNWGGRGLQGELTAGYEFGRRSLMRLFVQADASVPLFNARSETFTYPQPGAVESAGNDRRHMPSVVVSLGVGWHSNR